MYFLQQSNLNFLFEARHWFLIDFLWWYIGAKFSTKQGTIFVSSRIVDEKLFSSRASFPAPEPKKVVLLPVLIKPALYLKALLSLPATLAVKDSSPEVALGVPALFAYKARYPNPALLAPVVPVIVCNPIAYFKCCLLSLESFFIAFGLAY